MQFFKEVVTPGVYCYVFVYVIISHRHIQLLMKRSVSMGTKSLLSGPNSPMGNGAFEAMLAAYLTIVVVMSIATYIAFVIPVWKLYKKAGQKNPWLAFIPIAQYWPFFWTIRKSTWNILWFFLPTAAAIVTIPLHAAGVIITALAAIAVFVLVIVWAVQFFKAFNMSPFWLFLLFLLVIPVIGLIANLIPLYIMAFNDDYQYQL